MLGDLGNLCDLVTQGYQWVPWLHRVTQGDSGTLRLRDSGLGTWGLGGLGDLDQSVSQLVSQMFRCSDVQMFRCLDVQMFKCSDVQMFRQNW